MSIPSTTRPDYLSQGELARLIPSGADSAKERRITSATLAVLMAVEPFGKELLKLVGAPTSKRAHITCFTEVVFKDSQKKDDKSRPDGLILVELGSRTWSALIEAKVGSASLDQEQVENYLDIAKAHGVDAVITISNQFAPRPDHHPIQVSKVKTKSVDLYHWSWMSIISEATLLAEHVGIDDKDQTYILTELIRYLQDPASGVVAATTMGTGWRDVCAAIQHDEPLKKTGDSVIGAVGNWHQLLRYMSLRLSLLTGHGVSVYMKRAHAQDAKLRLKDEITSLTQDHRLVAEFDVPHAAARLSLTVDHRRRTISASMHLKAPTDKKRSSALVTWALGQVSKCEDADLIIRASWPGRAPDTSACLGALREDKAVILNANNALMPTAFEFTMVKDVAGKFRGAKTFVHEVETLLPHFYSSVGQHLRAWVAPAPKVETIPMQAAPDPEAESVAAEACGTDSQESLEG